MATPMCSAWGWGGIFLHASVSAREVGVAKPDVRIFQHGAQAAGVPAQQVLHIGDDAHLDGVGGLQAGMQVAWLNRAGHDWTHAPHAPHLTVADPWARCALIWRRADRAAWRATVRCAAVLPWSVGV